MDRAAVMRALMCAVMNPGVVGHGVTMRAAMSHAVTARAAVIIRVEAIIRVAAMSGLRHRA
jgi:hypothetical protein